MEITKKIDEIDKDNRPISIIYFDRIMGVVFVIVVIFAIWINAQKETVVLNTEDVMKGIEQGKIQVICTNTITGNQVYLNITEKNVDWEKMRLEKTNE